MWMIMQAHEYKYIEVIMKKSLTRCTSHVHNNRMTTNNTNENANVVVRATRVTRTTRTIDHTNHNHASTKNARNACRRAMSRHDYTNIDVDTIRVLRDFTIDDDIRENATNAYAQFERDDAQMTIDDVENDDA